MDEGIPRVRIRLPGHLRTRALRRNDRRSALNGNTLLVAVIVLAATRTLPAADWTNSGGDPCRNCLSTEEGPAEATLLWSGGRTSLIAWQPVTMGDVVFVVRQAGWPGSAGDAPVVAMDLSTGGELWATDVPASPGDWTTWIAGARDGLVYACRGGNGSSVSAPVYALDAATGSIAWISDDEIDAGAYDGVVFATDGDLIVASFEDIWRIDSSDGSTVWHSARTGSVSGNCGGALYGNAFYVADAVPGGHSIVRYDAVTGAEMYSSPVMPGFTLQCTPMVGPDGTVYLSRTQNNPSVDFFYAFDDNGVAFTEKWRVASAWSTCSEFAVGPDGSVLMMAPGPRIARLDPADGSILQQSGIIAGFSSSRFAIDAQGRVFFSNGGFAGGHFYAYSADLEPLWDVPVTNINIGGPALGGNGTLVICGIGTDVRAFRSDTGIGQHPPGSDGFLEVRVSPNPSSGPATASITNVSPGPVKVGVYDLAGRLLRSWCFEFTQGGPLEVPISGLPPGAYVFRASAPPECAAASFVILE